MSYSMIKFMKLDWYLINTFSYIKLYNLWQVWSMKSSSWDYDLALSGLWGESSTQGVPSSNL